MILLLLTLGALVLTFFAFVSRLGGWTPTITALIERLPLGVGFGVVRRYGRSTYERLASLPSWIASWSWSEVVIVAGIVLSMLASGLGVLAATRFLQSPNQTLIVGPVAAAHVTHVDRGNGAGLAAAVTAANAVAATSGGALIIIHATTINLDAASAPTTPYSLSAGVEVWGDSRVGTVIQGRSAVGADQGIFVLANGCRVNNLSITVREPLGATVGSTAVISGTTNCTIEDVSITCSGTLDNTESNNLTLRSLINMTSASSGNAWVRGCTLAGNGWQISAFVASNFVGVVSNISQNGLGTVVSECNLSGFDICVDAPRTCRIHDSSLNNFRVNAIRANADIGWLSHLTVDGCMMFSATASVDYVTISSVTVANVDTGVAISRCTFSAGAATQVGISLRNGPSTGSVNGANIVANYFSTATGVLIESQITDTHIGPNGWASTCTTMINDSGSRTHVVGHSVSFTGTFAGGAGLLTRYATFTQAGVSATQLRIPIPGGGRLYRIRLWSITNTLAGTVTFTVMRDTSTTALTATYATTVTGTVTAATTTAITYASTETVDLQLSETGLGTLEFSGVVEII